VRFWYALGVLPLVNPPHRPDLNAFVERLHGTVEREYRQIQMPGSLEATRESLPGFVRHYNHDRPHQGSTCANRPPAMAHPQLPVRPRLPIRVDPDRWLEAYHERCFARRVKANGSFILGDQAYYLGRQYGGREVVAQLDATTRQVRFLEQRRVVDAKPLAGLVGQELPLEAFVRWCEQEARRLWRRYLGARRSFQHAS
jgi:hypothetical protein